MPTPANLYFNSIKVRLEPTSDNALEGTPVFQFHKGAIRTFPDSRCRCFFAISIP